jgi:hypothetical protein
MVLMMRSDAGPCVVVWVFLDTKFMRDVSDGDGMESSFIYHEIQRSSCSETVFMSFMVLIHLCSSCAELRLAQARIPTFGT